MLVRVLSQVIVVVVGVVVVVVAASHRCWPWPCFRYAHISLQYLHSIIRHSVTLWKTAIRIIYTIQCVTMFEQFYRTGISNFSATLSCTRLLNSKIHRLRANIYFPRVKINIDLKIPYLNQNQAFSRFVRISRIELKIFDAESNVNFLRLKRNMFYDISE